MGTMRNVVIETRPIECNDGRHIEICEHKGVGHPDTLTDGACEAAACALAAAYEGAFGHVLHFNVDKGLLVAGSSKPRFGGGEIVEPIKLIVCGRATPGAGRFDVGEIVTTAVTEYLRRTLRADPGIFLLIPEIKAGSPNLSAIYAKGKASAVANDTSFGAGYAPLSELESQVMQLAALLRSDGFRSQYPAAGDDFKIMGLRIDDTSRVTVALAMVDRHVVSADHYRETRRAIEAHLAGALPAGVTLRINCLDQADARDESDVYLTVSGLSAEMGDDGQAGRGNRVNGLITPGRPMSLEGVAGKNPVSHVGKVYNVLADAIAHDIVSVIDGVGAAQVQLLSTIGEPLDQPQVALVQVTPAHVLADIDHQQIDKLVNAWFDRIGELTSDLVHGRISIV